MKVVLDKLTFQNFKGFKEKEVEFEKDLTTISGDNATGKTTVFDGFSWLLWGKDSQNRKDYEIKPYKESGDSIHNVETTVECVLDIDGQKTNLKRIYKEVWKKKRGSNNKEFSGHTTDFYINDVPKKKKDYEEFIQKIVSEDEFNLLSNPIYFNQIIDKKERRKILLSLVDDVEKDDVIKENKDLKELDLDSYSIEELQAMAKSSCKKINEELKEIPARIDELNNTKTDEDFSKLEDEKEKIKKELEKIDKELSGAISISEELDSQYEKISKLKEEINSIKNNFDESKSKKLKENNDRLVEVKRKIDACNYEIINSSDRVEWTEDKIRERQEEYKIINKKINGLRNEFSKLKMHKFDGSLICPTCGQEFTEEKKEEVLQNFNVEKSEKLEENVKKGKNLNEDLEKIKKEVKGYEEELKNTKSKLQTLKNKKVELTDEEKQLNNNSDKIENIQLDEDTSIKIKRLEEEIETIQKQNKDSKKDNTPLLERKGTLNERLDDINSKVSLKGLNTELDTKISEYEQKEKDLASQYEEKQKILYLCDEYIRAYTELVSDKVNNLFTFVKFKLFDTQINGGIQETAEATYKGVPYGSLNNAAKINAGLDVINALSKKFDKQIPIFVDNAESVNELVDVDSQLIRLVVSKYKNLRIEK